MARTARRVRRPGLRPIVEGEDKGNGTGPPAVEFSRGGVGARVVFGSEEETWGRPLGAPSSAGRLRGHGTVYRRPLRNHSHGGDGRPASAREACQGTRGASPDVLEVAAPCLFPWPRIAREELRNEDFVRRLEAARKGVPEAERAQKASVWVLGELTAERAWAKKARPATAGGAFTLSWRPITRRGPDGPERAGPS